jgi:hypothetical protein
MDRREFLRAGLISGAYAVAPRFDLTASWCVVDDG